MIVSQVIVSLGGDASGSVKQAPKYRRLCKHGDNIKRVSSISFDACHDGFEKCNIPARAMSNKIEHAAGELKFVSSQTFSSLVNIGKKRFLYYIAC